MREHRLIFEAAPSEGLPASLSANIMKMGTPEWKEEVKTAVQKELSELKQKVQLDAARKLIEAREGSDATSKEQVAAEKRILVELINNRLALMEAVSAPSLGTPSGVPEPMRKELEAGIAKAIGGAAGLETAGKFLKMTPADGAHEVLRIVDLAWNKLAASVYGAIAKIPFIGDSFKLLAEKAKESVTMLEMQGGFALLTREMRSLGRELRIVWNGKEWVKWKDAHQKSGKPAKDFAREIAKQYVESNAALTGEIPMADIPLTTPAPTPPKPDAPKPAPTEGPKPVETAAGAALPAPTGSA